MLLGRNFPTVQHVLKQNRKDPHLILGGFAHSHLVIRQQFSLTAVVHLSVHQ